MADTRRELSALQTLLADNSSGDIDAQDIRDTLVSESPSFIHPTSAFTSPPSTPVTGDLWLPSDGVSTYRYSGSAWVPWGPIYPLTDPALQSWSWLNQGSASVSTVKGGIFLSLPTGDADVIRGRVKTVPASPYTIDALLLPRIWGGNNPWAGVLWTDATKVIGFGVLNSSGGGAMQLYVRKYDTVSSFNSNVLSAFDIKHQSPIWLRIKDDNTNRTAWASHDGQNWLQVYSEGRTTFLTATQVGFFGGLLNCAYDIGVTLLSWKES